MSAISSRVTGAPASPSSQQRPWQRSMSQQKYSVRMSECRMTSPTSMRLPNDWSLPMLDEVFVALQEMSVAHEAAHGTERAGVSAREDKVSALVDEGSLSACRSAPEHEDKMFASLAEGSDGSIGEGLPALAAMAEGLVFANRKTGVQEEDALPCPACQVAAHGDGCSRLGLNLLEDVLERGREGYAVVHAEAESVRLSGAVVRVLPQDDHAHLMERCRVEGIEDEPPGRIASARRVLLPHELRQRLEIRLVELLLQLCLPRRFYLNIHVFSYLSDKGTIFF